MIAIEISSFGPPEVLRPVERPVPEPKAGELLIRVSAAGVARADLIQRRGHYPPPPGASEIPGLDVAGVVESTGSSPAAFNIGDRVCAILAGGGYAEYCAVPWQQVLPIPENWTDIEAASLPENIFTVYDNLITRGQLRAGETALIHGGTSGIGSMALMLSRLQQAHAIATAGSPEKCKACLELGAVEAINYKEQDFPAEVKRLTKGRGVDVILDMVGGSYLHRNLDCLAEEGRLAVVATQGGRTGDLDLGKLMHKRGRIIASTMRARTPEQKGLVAQALLRDVWPHLPERNAVRPLIDSTFPLVEAARAHARLEQGDHIGKVVLVTGRAK